MKKTIYTILFFVLSISVNAQGPFTGFFGNKEDAIKSVAIKRDAVIKNQVLVRMTANMTATAYDFYTKPAQIQFCKSAGIGLSLARYEETESGIYCKLAVNALFLTSVEFNDHVSAVPGFAFTGGLFNNVLQFGIGYLDKKVMPLIGVGVTF